MNYDLVYDAANNNFEAWKSILTGVGFIIIGAVLVFSPTVRSVIARNASEKFVKLFAKCFFGFATLITLVSSCGALIDHNTVKSAAKNNTCTIVEGRIEKFRPMPYGGNQLEKFEIRNVNFAYSDYVLTGGFNNTSSHGGPILEGLQARICYIKPDRKKSNIIVRLEIAQ